ncbi:phospholipase C [Geosmithia morbida]|uniref:Phosphoinositide phospholipase C n=1 Tax=Geosmithia morbida TaxID=1094350 RepID=A0A9P4YSY9_9HYPO|nr:phospholipase C [Geosmithia morbida]KAF4121153.1 phospholipase C [Geosmithia morbida]
MTDTNLTHQAGGGGAGESTKVVETLGDHMISHLRRIYQSHSRADGKWGNDEVQSFLHNTQHYDKKPDADTAQTPIAGGLLDDDEVDFDTFLHYMTSPHGSFTKEPEPTDLSWPLSSYFISSSHNTYLSGNQLSSDSTTDSYTNVLLRGCRCVEIDVWDGDDSDSETSSLSSEEGAATTKSGTPQEQQQPPAPQSLQKRKTSRLSKLGSIRSRLPSSLASRLDKTSIGKRLDEAETTKTLESSSDSTVAKKAPAETAVEEDGPQPEVAAIEPRVLHGYTLTKEITFREVCVAIAQSAFVVTDLPVIVSLEVHCNPQQQACMVQIMNEVWADYLIPIPEAEPAELPRLEQLKKKILVKVKYAPPGSSPDEPVSSDEEEAAQEPLDGSGKPKKKKKASKIIQDLSRMGFYCRGVSFKSFDQAENSLPTHIYSLNEKKWSEHHTKNTAQLWEHNKRYLMRAYPSGLRIGSSNLNPAPFWGAGTQIVALNWQQTDESIMLNEGMFSGTGGYVLKPKGFHPDLPDHPAATTDEVSCKTLKLGITFLAAQSIPLPPGDKSTKGFNPYIKVELHVDGTESYRGGRIDCEGHEREDDIKIRTRTHKGSDVDLGVETLEFKQTSGLIEDLTFVRFTVRDDEIGRDDLAAWACVRLDRLGEGYRFVRLLNMHGQPTDGFILVRVDKQIV